MLSRAYNKVKQLKRRGTSLIALVSLLASGLTFLSPPPPAAAAIVTSNLVLNLDASNTSSMAATGATGWNSVSPASSTPTSTFFGNAARVSDATGASMSIDGSSDAAVFAAGTARTAGAMTIETWVKPGNLRAGWNILASRWFPTTGRAGSAADQDWHFALYGSNSSNIKLQLNTGAGILTGNTVFPATSANKWYHLAVTIDAANTATMWVNGVADGSLANFPHTDNATAQLHVGDVGADTALLGNMSRFRIYNTALTSAQMAQNFLTDSANYGYAPTNTVVPAVSGDPRVGKTLTTTAGTWGVGDSDGTTTSYKWQASTNGTTWTDISAATASTFTLTASQAGNTVRSVVTKTNSVGTTSANSIATASILPATAQVMASGSKLTGLTSTVPNDASSYNVTLSSSNLASRFALGTTTGLTVITGYASTASYMAATIGASAPIISFRGTGTAINTALANVTYTGTAGVTDVIKLNYAGAGATDSDTKNYIPIYDNGQLTFHYYAYKVHATGKNRADMDAALVGLSTTDNVQSPGPWYLTTPRYQVEWDRIKLVVGQNQSFMGARADAGSANWYWPANTDGYSTATTFGTQSGNTVTATSNIYNGSNTTLPFHSGEPNAGTSVGRSGFFYIVGGVLGWDDVTLDNSGVPSFTMETYGTAPFNTGSVGAFTQSVRVVTLPGAPTSPASTILGATANVTWVAPASAGSDSITDYAIEYSTDQVTWTAWAHTPTTSTSATVGGLTPGLAYAFRIAAITTGQGSYSTTLVSTVTPTTINVVTTGGGVADTDYVLSSGVIYNKTAATISINASDIQSALLTGGVKIAADTVNVNSPITWSTSQTISLGNNTSSTVNVNQSISTSGTTAGVVIAPATYNLAVKSATTISLTGASSTLSIGGNAYTLIRNEAGLVATTTTGNFALARPITLSTSYTASPINVSFSGTLDGLGNTIDSMGIGATTTERNGLINSLATGGVVRNLGVTNANITLSSTSYRVGVIAGGSTGGTIDQVWSTGFIRTTTTNTWLALGGLIGNAQSGTLNISRAWSSVNIDSSSSGSTTRLEQGGIIGGNELDVGQTYQSSGGIVNLSQVYATGTLKWASTGHRGIGGLFGLHYSSSGAFSITDSFSWVTFATGVPSGNSGGIIGVAAGSTSTITRGYQTTSSSCVASGSNGFTATPNCDTQRTPGETISGISGSNWATTGASILINLAAPYRPLYVQVIAPTDGSYGTVSYQIVDGSGAVQNTAALSAMNLSVSGTPVYKAAGVVLNASSAKATYSTYYASGLTLGGTSAGQYSLNPWRDNTSVTISKYPQTVTWAPTTSVSFGSGTFTPSPAPVASGGTTVTYSVSSAGTTGCTVNSSTGAITYTKGGSCAITATAANAGDWLIASDTETFVIAEPATAPTSVSGTVAGSGSLNLGWAAPIVNSTAPITGYQINYSLSNAMTSPTTVNIGATQGLLITGLTNATAYYFTVRAFSGSTWVGPDSTVATATPSATATTINVVVSGGGTPGTDFKINGGVISGAGTINVNEADVESILATEGAVQLAATNVNVNAPINWSSNSVLTLGSTSASVVNVNSTIAGSGATAGVRILPTTYSLAVKSGSHIRLTGATPSFNLGGTAYTVVNTVAGLANVAAGATWALTAPITLTGTYTTAVKDITFAGIMDGLGNTISNMQINVTATRNAGFYMALGGATVRNVGFTNVNITSPTDSINTRLGAVAGDGSNTASVTNTVNQVWANGFINQSGSTGANTEAGGLFGGATLGTLNISKSWSSVAVSTGAAKVGSGGIIGTNTPTFGSGPAASAAVGNVLSISESYSTGNILRNLPATASWYGNAGIIGVAYGWTTTITNAFAWGNINSSGTQAGVSTAGISGVGTATITNAYTTHASCGGTTITNCVGSVVPGTAPATGTGFGAGLWSTVNGASLVNLTPPTKLLYVRVKAPTDGSFGTVSTEIVDSTGTVQTLSSLSLSVSGTPVFDTISSSTLKGTYSANFVSGLTLGGSSAGVYSLGAWINSTSVTISKYNQTISYSSTIPTTPKVSGTYTPTATSTSGLTVALTVDAASSAICSIASGVITFNAVGTCLVNANQAGNADYIAASQAQQSMTVAKGDQTVSITSTAPTGTSSGVGKTYSLTGSATSSLTPSYSVDSASASVCTLSGTTVTLAAVGTCKVLVNQAGNANWNAATQSFQSFTVGKGAQTITFNSTAPTAAVVSGATYTISGTVTGGGTVTFSIDAASAAVCSVSGSVVSFQTAGTCKVLADSIETANWNAATQNFQTFTVGKGTPTLAFTSTASSPKVNSNYTPVASSSSTGAITYTIDATTSTVCSITAGVVSFLTVGTCKVNANQVTDSDWLAATQAQQTITAIKGDQTITVSTTAAAPKVNTTYTPTATSTSGGVVAFTVDATTSSVCSITAGVVSFLTVGTCKVNANQVGGTNWNAATQVQEVITVAKGDQSITFSSTAPAAAVVSGATYTVTGTSTSGGTVAFTVDAASSAVCSIAAGVVSFQSAGTCKVLANQAGGTNWNAATQNFQNFTVGKGTTTLAFTSTASSPKVNTAYTPVATSSGTGTVTYTIDSTASSVCSISAGVVTFNAVGTCKVNANQATDANWLAPAQAQQSITTTKGDQTITFSSTAPAAAVVSGASYSPAGTSTSGETVVFTIDAASAAVCSSTSGSVTFQSAGTCKVLANQAGNANWNAATQNFQSFTVGKGTPTLTFTSSASSPKVNTTYTPVASSSSSGTVTYAIDSTSASVCSISAGVVSFTTVGTCKVNASQLSDGNWLSVSQVQQTITVVQGDQAISFSSTSPASAVVGGVAYTPAATSTSGGTVAFTIDAASAAVCSIAAGAVSFQAAGSCKVLANQAGNSNWNAATQNSQSFTVGKGTTALSFTSTAATPRVTTTYTPVASSSGTGTVTYTIDSTTSSICSITAGVVTFNAVGTCKVNANQAADANWLTPAQAQQTITSIKGDQTIAFTSTAPIAAVVSGASYSPSGTSTSGGNVVFTIDAASSAVCSNTSGTITFQSVGNCKVLANQAGDDNWNAATQNFQTFTVGKGTPTLAFISTPASPKVNTTYTPVASSSSTGTVSYVVDATSSSVCSITSGLISFLTVGTCKVNASQLTDGNWLSVSQVQQTITVVQGDQTISFSSTSPASAVVGGVAYTPAATSTSGGTVAFTIDAASSAVCSITAGAVSFQTVGTCRVLANQAGNTNWNAATQNFQTFTVAKGSQGVAITSTAPTNAAVDGSSYTVTATGGAGSATVTLTIDATSSAICSIASGVVTFLKAGACKVNANQAADTNYNAANQIQQVITVGKGAQAVAVTSTAPTNAAVDGATYTPTATGGASGLSVTFSIDPASASKCVISGGTISFTAVGNCVVKANQLGNADYNSAAEVTQTISVGQGAQSISFTSSVPNGAVVDGNRYMVAAAGGASGNPVYFSIDPSSSEICSETGGSVSFTAAGDCVVRANQNGSTNYLSATQITQTITVGKGAQVIAFTSAAPGNAVVDGSHYKVSATGGATNSEVTFTIDAISSSICSISGAEVSFTAAGICKVSANQLGNSNYNAATQVQQSISVGKGSQSVSFSSLAPIGVRVGDSGYFPTANRGASTGSVSISVAAESAAKCSISNGEVSFVAAGNCVLEISQLGDLNYNEASPVIQTITIFKGLQVISQTNSLPLSAVVDGSSYTPTLTGGPTGNQLSVQIDIASAEVCVVSNGTISFIGAGNCRYLVNQTGNANYEDATEYADEFTVGKGSQVITFTTTVPTASVGGATYTPAAAGGATGYPVVLRVDSSSVSVCVISSGVVRFIGVGTCLIGATQSGDANYETAQNSQSFTVAKGAQAISFTSSAGSRVVGGAQYTPAANGGASGKDVVFGVAASSSAICALVAGKVSFQTPGDCVIEANQDGNTNYLSAPTQIQTIFVGKGAQVLTFTSRVPANAKVGGTTYQPIVSGGPSSSAVVLTIAAGSAQVCELSNGVVSFTGVGSCVIEANQGSDSNYNAANQLTQIVSVAKGLQSVSFTSTPPSLRPVQGTFYTPSASGSASSIPIVFTIAPQASTLCSINKGVISFLAVGDCVVYADQAGNSNWNAASRVTQIFDITKGEQVITYLSSAPTDAAVGGASYTPTALGGAGTKQVTFGVSELSTDICSVANGEVSFQAAGECLIVANQASDINYNAATPVVQSIQVGRGSQAISFSSIFIAARVEGTSYRPVSTGGLSVSPARFSIASISTGICEIVDGNVYFHLVGDCEIELNQDGDANYKPAESVTQVISVAKGAQLPLVTQTSLTSLLLGETPPTAVIGTKGGSGLGAVTWSISPSSSSICSLSGDVVTGLSVGNCELVATKGGDDNFLETTAVLAILVSTGGQSAVRTLVNSANPVYEPGLSLTLSLEGGNGSGDVWFESLTSRICSVAGSTTLNINHAGTCTVIGHKDGDGAFQSAAAMLSFEISKASQAGVVFNLEAPLLYSATTKISSNFLVTGAAGSASRSFSVTSGNCAIEALQLVATSAGSCDVRLDLASTEDYQSYSATRTFNISKGLQSQITATRNSDAPRLISFVGVNSTTFRVSGGSGSGSLQVSTSSAVICSATIADRLVTITGISTGTCAISVLKSGDTNYQDVTTQFEVPVVGLPNAPTNLTLTNTGTNTINGMEVRVSWTAPSQVSGQAPVSGFEVQSKSGTNWVTVTDGILAANSTSLSIFIPAWSSMLLRVAPISEVDPSDRVLRNWANYTAGANEPSPVAFQVPGTLSLISTSTAAVSSGETVTLTGSGFDSNVATSVELTSGSSVFAAGIRAAAIANRAIVPATVLSSTQISFVLPKITMPKGVATLPTQVKVLANGIASAPTSFSYIPKKLSQVLTAALPAAKTIINMGSTFTSSTAVTSSNQSNPPIVTATPSSICSARINALRKLEITTVSPGECSISVIVPSTPAYTASAAKTTTVLIKGTRTPGLTATADSVSATGERVSHTYDVTSALSGPTVNVFVGENPLDVPVTLNKHEGTVLFTVDAAAEKAGVCSADGGEVGTLVGSITMLDVGTCKVTITTPADAAWTAGPEIIVITVVGTALPDGAVDPTPVSIGDAQLAPEDTDTSLVEPDTEPAVALDLSPTVAKEYAFGGEDGFGYDPVAGKLTLKSRTIFVGTWNAVFRSPSADKKWFKVMGKVVKKKQTYVDAASCTIKLTVKKDPKLKKKVLRVVGAGCELSASGKAAFTSVGVQKIKLKFKRGKQYASTGLNYKGTAKAKTRLMKPVTRTIVIKVGRVS